MVRRSLAGPENIQQRGHHYEALWRRLLIGWLPPQYQIGTRKYLLLEHEVDGRTYSHETDLVIYHPSYPRELRERSEVLISGVVAAFSVKSRLENGDLAEAIAEARLVRAGIAERSGLIGELVSPLIFGLLAHSHDLTGANPLATVSDALMAETRKDEHPRRQLDLVCVADLDCWYRTTSMTQHEIPSPPSDEDYYADFWHSAWAVRGSAYIRLRRGDPWMRAAQG